MSAGAGFAVGPLIAFDGGDGEAITASGSLIATLGATRATWWAGAIPHTLELPNIPVRGARWSADGAAILVGTGMIDVIHEVWLPHPAFISLIQRGPPGEGNVVIQAASWSADRRYAAAMLGWAGPRPKGGATPRVQVVVLDLVTGAVFATLPADGASGVRIVGERVIIAAPVVRAWTFAGIEVAALSGGRGAPLALSGGDDGEPVILIDADFSIRVVDPTNWAVRATWAGSFLDAVPVPGGLIAVDLAGLLHAGCLEAGEVREVGAAETRVRAAHLAVTGDARIVIMGAGAVPVHALSYRLRCGVTA